MKKLTKKEMRNVVGGVPAREFCVGGISSAGADNSITNP